MNVIFNIMLPRNSPFLKNQHPFRMEPVETTENTADEIAFKLKPIYGATYSIAKCTFGQRRKSDLILRNG